MKRASSLQVKGVFFSKVHVHNLLRRASVKIRLQLSLAIRTRGEITKPVSLSHCCHWEILTASGCLLNTQSYALSR